MKSSRTNPPGKSVATRPRISFFADRSKNYFIKLRSKHWVDIFDRKSRKRLHAIKLAEVIEDADCHPARCGRRLFDAVTIGLKDGQTQIHDAKNGRLLKRLLDPCADPAVQARLDVMMESMDNPNRYAVVFATAERNNAFYNFSDGGWECGPIPDGCLFKDCDVATAAAAVLTKQRKQRDKQGGLSGGGERPRPLQTVAVRKIPARWRFLGKVRGRYESYIPILPWKRRLERGR